MGVTTNLINKPLNPRAQDASPLAYNRAALYSGKALSFDGVNDLLTMPTALTSSLSTTTITHVLNFKTDFSSFASSRDDVFSYNERGIIFTFNFGNIVVYYRHSGGSWGAIYIPTDKIKLQEWNHCAIVIDYNNDLGKVYINGHEVVSISSLAGANIAYDSNALTIGGQTGARFFDGQLSGFKIFNTALTAAQIADLYNFPEKIVPTGLESNLKLWLPMMETTGTTAYDGSGNGNHGTISGATYVNAVGAPVAQTSVIDWNKGSNLAKFSEEFDNADWTTGGASIISNQTTSPNGILNADKFIESAALGIHVVNNSSPITGTATSTASVFYKKGTRRYFSIKLQIGGSSYTQVFDSEGLVTGSNYSNGLTNVVTTIEDYGNGWGRFSIKGTSPSGVFTYAIFALSDSLNPTFDAGNFNPKYTGTGTDYGYFWGAQVNAGSVGPYIPTLSTAQPTPVLLPAGLTTGRDITGVNLFENVRKQSALNLDGQSWAEVHDNASLDVTTAVTLEAWVYWDGSNSSKGILGRWFSGNASYMLYANNSTTLYFFINTSHSAATISGTGWKHIVGTYDSTTRRVYIDGQEIGSGDAYNATIDVNDKPIEIGRYAGNTAYEYDGEIAQPRIYNRALTASEVLRNYNSGKNTYTNS